MRILSKDELKKLQSDDFYGLRVVQCKDAANTALAYMALAERLQDALQTASDMLGEPNANVLLLDAMRKAKTALALTPETAMAEKEGRDNG